MIKFIISIITIIVACLLVGCAEQSASNNSDVTQTTTKSVNTDFQYMIKPESSTEGDENITFICGDCKFCESGNKSGQWFDLRTYLYNNSANNALLSLPLENWDCLLVDEYLNLVQNAIDFIVGESLVGNWSPISAILQAYVFVNFDTKMTANTFENETVGVSLLISSVDFERADWTYVEFVKENDTWVVFDAFSHAGF